MEAAAARPARWSREVKTLGEAARQFSGKRSPKVIAAVVALAALGRIAVGDFSWRDGAAAAVMLAIYPFGEWAIHVFILHMKPLRFRGREVESPVAAAHRRHHEEPNDLTMILLDSSELAQLMLIAVPFVIVVFGTPIWLLAGPIPLGALLSAALAAYVAIGLYEWTHYLIHTAYRPGSRYYRTIWRTHRLHHFKNERYWHGITQPLADRVLGTFPEQREIERSPTARTLNPANSGATRPINEGDSR